MQIKSFTKNETGGVAIIFALSLLPLVGAAGSALDYSRATSSRAALQSYSDSAALTGAKALAEGMTQAAARDIAEKNFRGNLSTNPAFKNVIVSGVAKVRDQLTMDFNANFQQKSTFLSVIGINETKIGTKASATYGDDKGVGEPLYIHFIIDNSQSMGLPSDKVGIDKMISIVGCAFACHQPHKDVPTPGYSTTSDIAKKNKIKLRIDSLRESVLLSINHISQEQKTKNIHSSFYTFAEKITSNTFLTKDMNLIKSKINIMKMETDGTMFYNIAEIDRMIDRDIKIKPKGKNIIIFASDGFNSKLEDFSQVFPMKIETCESFKKKDWLVAVMGIKYTDLMDFPNVMAQIPTAKARLQSCASKDMFVEVNNGNEFAPTMKKMLEEAIKISSTAPRISK